MLLLSEFHVDELPNTSEDMGGLLASHLVLQESATPSEQPFPPVVDNALDVFGKQSASLLGKLLLVLQCSTFPTSKLNVKQMEDLWIICIDGSCNKVDSGIRCLIIIPSGQWVGRLVRLKFKDSNNEAEYEVYGGGLSTTKHMEFKDSIYDLKVIKHIEETRIQLFTDFKLIESQLGGLYQA